jgi:predicted Zn-dependent protease
LRTAVERAIDVWNSVPRFREYTLEAVASRRSADIVVYDRRAPSPLKAGSCAFDPRGAGYTYFCIDEVLRRAEVLDAVDATSSVAGVLISVDRGAVSSTAEYEAVVAHELGHALGIGGHSLDPGDLMYGAPTVAAPSTRDRQTLLYVLGATPWALLDF